MKTQLLEDIGQSATLTLVPAKKAGESDTVVQEEQPPRVAHSVTPRSSFGVWRQKPVVEPAAIAAANQPDQPDQQPTPQELNSVFEEIAALEAQYVPPTDPQEPSVVPQAAEYPIVAAEGAPVQHNTRRLAEPALDGDWMQSAADRPDPLFDFTPPTPAPAVAEPFTPVPSTLKVAQQRYLLWGSLALSAVLLIQGGRWLYDQRDGAVVAAVVPTVAKGEPQLDKAVQRRALAEKEFTLGPDGDVQVKPVAPASTARTSAVPPPLVLLENESASEAKPEQPQTRETEPAASDNRPIAKQETPPTPATSRVTTRGQSGTAGSAASSRGERVTARQPASASTKQPEAPSERGAVSAETLKACREHGYHAAQCVKRACSVTKYGFVCRG